VSHRTKNAKKINEGRKKERNIDLESQLIQG
jgi:hypothetical protein